MGSRNPVSRYKVRPRYVGHVLRNSCLPLPYRLIQGCAPPFAALSSPRWDDSILVFRLSLFRACVVFFFFGERFKIIVGLFREGNGTDAPRSIHFYPLLRIACHGSKELKTESMTCVARYILVLGF